MIREKLAQLKHHLKKLRTNDRSPDELQICVQHLTETQALFCEWNAERLGISIEESYQRYIDSWNSIPGGHGGRTYRDFCDQNYEIFRVFFDDNQQEVFETYRFYSHLHFLRMLSKEGETWLVDHPVFKMFSHFNEIKILDFGCGIAQHSRSLAMHFKEQGKTVELILADIPTIRKPFLQWLGKKTEIVTTFLDCTPEQPIPALPSSHICIVTEVFEHLHEPIPYLHHLDSALLPGGLLITRVGDHNLEFFHVSPNLQPVREELSKRQYRELVQNQLFQKPEGYLD